MDLLLFSITIYWDTKLLGNLEFHFVQLSRRFLMASCAQDDYVMGTMRFILYWQVVLI